MVIARTIDRLNEAVGRVVCLIAALFAVIIIYDVVMRYVFNAPTRWAFDVSKQLYGFYFVMLGGYALRHQAHVRVDLVTNALSAGVRRWVEIVGYILFFFPFAWVFLTRSYEFALTSWTQREVTYGAIQMPVYPLKAALCLAAALLLLQGISETLKLILNRGDDRP